MAKKLCSPEHAKTHHLDSLEQEISFLEKAISMDHQEIGFCHNDLQYGNIMIDDDKSITIIVCFPFPQEHELASAVDNSSVFRFFGLKIRFMRLTAACFCFWDCRIMSMQAIIQLLMILQIISVRWLQIITLIHLTSWTTASILVSNY